MKNLNNFITSIQNGYKSKVSSVKVSNSKFNLELLKILKYTGYIYGFKIDNIKTICIFLKYNKGLPAISNIYQVSKPKKKTYTTISSLDTNSLSLTILSTNLGIMSHYDALKLNLGGEVLVKVN